MQRQIVVAASRLKPALPQGLAQVIGQPSTVDPAVSRAHTWLLAVGWRRLGLLDPADVPG